jgi:hypothetical protein
MTEERTGLSDDEILTGGELGTRSRQETADTDGTDDQDTADTDDTDADADTEDPS